MKIIILISLLLITTLSYTQNATLKGSLTDSKSEVIAFANITLKSKDKVQGTSSDSNGFFTFNELTVGTYTLNISFLGYKNVSKNIEITTNQTIPVIVLKENSEALNEVEIVYKKPTIVQKADRLIFNIQNTILSNQDSWSILNNTPSVFVNQDRIMVKSTIASIYINDKKVGLPVTELKSFLENLDGNSIKSIEVIANPSAKYDASSGSIINIVLKKTAQNNYKGTVNANYTIGIFDKYSLGTTHFYKKDKLSITASLNYSNNKHIIEETTRLKYFNAQNELTSNWFSSADHITDNLKYSGLLNVDYSFDKKNSVTLSTVYSELDKENNNVTTNGSIFSNANVLDSTYVANNKARRDNNFLSNVLDFTHSLNDKGQKITVALSHSLFKKEVNQLVDTDYFLPSTVFIKENKFNIATEQDIQIFTSKIDYVLPLKKGAKFETGIKFSTVASENDFLQFDFINNNFTLDLNKSNVFTYDENNYAFYTNYQKESKKLYYQIGLRGEYTKIKGSSKTTNTNEINEDDYFKIFPNFYLDYYPNGNNDFILSYKKSINRPRYQQLNPFQFFFSDFAANVGNPNLKPEISQVLNFKYYYKSKFSADLYYSHTKDRFSEISFQDNENNIVRDIITNLDTAESVGLVLGGTNDITKRWSVFTQLFFVNRFYDFIAIESNNKIIKQSKASYFVKIVNNFTLLKDKSLKANITYSYISKDNTYNAIETSRYLQTNFSLQKSLFKNKAVLTFGIDDVFKNAGQLSTLNYENQDIQYFTKPDTHFYKIGFRYSFGNNKLRENNRSKTNKEEERLDTE